MLTLRETVLLLAKIPSTIITGEGPDLWTLALLSACYWVSP